MDKHIIELPKHLDITESIEFISNLYSLPLSDEYLFDFHNIGFISPFSFLYLSLEIKRFRNLHPQCEFKCKGFESKTYAQHMGFFEAFGAHIGKLPGEAKGSSAYSPIKIFNTQYFLDIAKSNLEHVGYAIERESQNLAEILTRSNEGVIFDALSYSIREIIRNVIEHSQASQFGYCAQYWQSKNLVEVAILDTGIGISQSLRNNPKLKFSEDSEALSLSLIPGISRVIVNKSKVDNYDEWVNSGFGLYMTSRLCSNGGKFFICSGKSGLKLNEQGKNYLNTNFKGTAISMCLNTKKLYSLNEMLSLYLREGNKIGNVTTASMASKMLSKDFKKSL